MQTAAFRLLAASIATVASAVSLAGVKTTIEVNRDASATKEFRFANIRSPSQTDAATKAKFTVVQGRRDLNGGDVGQLNDGRLPAEEDEPASNFFFAAGSKGGRLLVDLGTEIGVTQINTFSWHANTRGPQVYQLYCPDPGSKDFDVQSATSGDLTKAGWRLLAEIDTRPKDKEPGGQYGVSIARSDGEALATTRYLLFDVSRTEEHDPFGNTFLSEIDIIGGKEPPPKSETGAADVLDVAGKYEIVFDTTELPEIKPWVDTTLKPICAAWYPKIVELLPSDNFNAPQRFTIVFHKSMNGVANTSRGRINCAGPWFLRNLEGEAAGAVVHEMVHVVQQYRRAPDRARNPGWMVEGVADYIRWFLYEPEDKRPHPNPRRANYSDSYRTTAAFLNYLVEHHDKEIVKKFNAVMREGKYSEDLWQQYAGKSVEDLWAEYIQTERK